MINSPLILYYIRDPKKERQITKLCKGLGFRIRALKTSDANVEIGVLAGISRAGTKKHEKAPALYQLSDFLVFSGVPDEALDRFLAEYKKAGIEPTGLKSVVTPHNLTWTVYELAAELVKERMSMLLGGAGRQ